MSLGGALMNQRSSELTGGRGFSRGRSTRPPAAAQVTEEARRLRGETPPAVDGR